MYWSNFLHIYQPPTQSEAIIRKVTDEGYRTLVRVLREAPAGKITLNINAVLTEQLARYGLYDVIRGLRELAERGQIEFTGSAMYHPILPLIPKDEVIRQVKLNNEVNQHYFGEVYKPMGFFPPEMCYSYEVARTVAELGFRWIIVDELSFNGKIGSVQYNRLYKIEGLGDFLVFFKERPLSAGITYGTYPSAEPFLAALKDRLEKHSYLLTGTDGEVYGHHRPGQEKLLSEVFIQSSLKTCTISELIRNFVQVDTVNPLPSSWSTWEDEMAQGIPYPQWQYPGHELHELQWQLTKFVLHTVKGASTKSPGFSEARRLLDEGLHSCQYWWASCRPWWSVEMIEWGAQRLYQAVESLGDAIDKKQKEEAGRLFQAVVSKAREWQESGEAQRLKQGYRREHPEVSTELTFGVR
jgi:alpha-amylase/alpha-mannosidase (GH57 family)